MKPTTLVDVIEHKAYARIGLLGNPSDVYYGNTISISIANFWASVKLEPSDRLVINPHPYHDLVEFDSLNYLVSMEVCVWLWPSVKYFTSTAKIIILIFMRGFLPYLMIQIFLDRHQVKVDERPTLILEAEKELGIVAGLQDRVAQVYGGLVFMDFSKTQMDRLGHGIYTPMDISLLPPLYLIYADNPSDSGKVHSTVRQRWLNGDEFIRSTMNEVANLAVEGRRALLEKDYAKLASLMNHNFDLRRSMFGDDALGAINLRMVEVARDTGAASKFTGSGGAVVAFCPDGPPQIELLQEACRKAGFIIQPVQVAPSFLKDLDLGSSSSA
ncbi:glucuronokinase 1 isoform X2 [Beta vulgaris subsp. vulgaris]|uniref:glucuronokinase 1 isoform X2 n=1 Tax=Beta vulgaris subsp. vulgaris TaxID=3555 RepID=UPI002547FAAA|nr:glucuronokinase 1 isoform X2 [Beta vulgaris subsp. vulgaris]